MPTFPAPPIRTPYDGPSGTFSRGWTQWFQAITNLFNAPPPTITGSRGGNAALTTLISSLASKGIVIDNTTP